jgi:hypothetical protein
LRRRVELTDAVASFAQLRSGPENVNSNSHLRMRQNLGGFVRPNAVARPLRRNGFVLHRRVGQGSDARPTTFRHSVTSTVNGFVCAGALKRCAIRRRGGTDSERNSAPFGKLRAGLRGGAKRGERVTIRPSQIPGASARGTPARRILRRMYIRVVYGQVKWDVPEVEEALAQPAKGKNACPTRQSTMLAPQGGRNLLFLGGDACWEGRGSCRAAIRGSNSRRAVVDRGSAGASPSHLNLNQIRFPPVLASHMFV